MKLRHVGIFFAGLIAVFVLAINSSILALDVPPLRGRVNDLAGMVPADRVQALDERLAAFERETGHQIAVLTIPSLQGDALEEFSIRVAEGWKIGQKGFDNGAILLVVRDDRKLRIEVGYGLEGVLPDAIANRIIREVIVPRFRDNDYPGGIEAGVNAILQVTKGEPVIAFGVAFDQRGESWMAAVLNQGEQFVVFFIGPSHRHNSDLTNVILKRDSAIIQLSSPECQKRG